MSDSPDLPTLVVAILTYQRPDDLVGALPRFLEQVDSLDGRLDAHLLVVDNDPAASAREFVTGYDHPRLRYVHEPRPGIAAGRNRALDEAHDRDVLVFADDDERPSPRWLLDLVQTWQRTGATCVVGPVVSEYEVEPTGWLAAGRFFDRRRMPTGSPITVAATNNLLVDLRRLAPTGLRFDEAFGLSGGSDTLFTRSLALRGEPMVWCDEAVVVDVVPASRTTRTWVLARARRTGNSATRVDVVLAGSPARRLLARVRGVVRGAVRVAGGAARTLVGVLTRSQVHDARGRRSVQRGLGMIAGALGHVVYEYRRDEPSGT